MDLYHKSCEQNIIRAREIYKMIQIAEENGGLLASVLLILNKIYQSHPMRS